MPGPLKTIALDYEGTLISYRNDGWFNATEAAAKWGKLPAEWLRLPSTKKYLQALQRKYGNFPHLKTAKGAAGGTWLHPKLAVAFARWLDDDFAVWCDEQIESLVRGKQDWTRLRHISAAGAKLQSEVLKEARLAEGKTTQPHHYANEHCMVNALLTGQFKGLDRDSMPLEQLHFIGHFEVRNSLLIAKGLPYDQRKQALLAEAQAWKTRANIALPPANDPGQLAA